MPQTTPAVPKIAVDSRGDILHLQRNLRSAAQAKVAESGAQGEQLKLVGKLVDRWVDEVFRLAGPNITVNGIEYEEAMADKEEYEPHDDRLDKLIQQRQQEAEDLLMRVSELRRDVPLMLSKLAADAEMRKTWGEAAGIVFKEEEVEVAGEEAVDVEEMVNELKETGEAVKEMAVTVPALESKLANAHSVMADLGLLTNPRESIGGMVRADDDEPSTPRRAVPALVKKLRGSMVGVSEMEVDGPEDQ